MPEAVIVATARSPIGRAFKGSLTTHPPRRPDRAPMIRAALAKVPQLDPADIDDLMLGCGLPGGEQGFNMARVVAVHARLRQPARHHGHPVLLLLAADHPDGVPRDQGRRGRRVHLRRRGDASAGSARAAATAGRTRKNPVFADAEARTGGAASGRRPVWHDPREDGDDPRRLHRDGPDRGERRPAARHHPPGAGRVRRPVAEPGREGARQRVLAARHHPGHAAGRHRGRPRTTARGPGTTLEKVAALQAGVPPGRHGHRGQLLPAQRRRRGGRRHERPQGGRARHHPAGPDRRPPASPALSPEIMGLGPVEASRQALARAGHDDRRHRPGRDQRGVRRAGHPVLPRARHRPSTSSTSTAARSRSATRSA